MYVIQLFYTMVAINSYYIIIIIIIIIIPCLQKAVPINQVALSLPHGQFLWTGMARMNISI